MLEIEMKFPVDDFARLERQLAAWGTVAEPPCTNSDHYFNAPDRDFAATDEALRLRRIGARNRITYKGPKHKVAAKVRTEIEVPLADGDSPAEDFMRLLNHLGYQPVAVVRKDRRSYHLQREGYDVEICLDEVQGLGRFAEVEILAPEEQLAKAQAVLEQVASALGLDGAERRSYLELLLAAKGDNPP
jgi:adenylate cyclase class 2